MRQVLLLRGINIGSRNRIAMPALRELLAAAGWTDVRTYLQSGNIVLSSKERADELARACEAHIAEGFGLDIEVLARTRDELAEVVRRNPLAEIAAEPKRYQVSFCSAQPDGAIVQRLSALAAPSERLVAVERELYAWHPEGIGRSRLAAELGGRRLGVTATSRNWTTVTSLLAMAEE